MIELIIASSSALGTALVAGMGLLIRRQLLNGGVRLDNNEHNTQKESHDVLIEVKNDLKHVRASQTEAREARKELREIIINHISDRGAHL